MSTAFKTADRDAVLTYEHPNGEDWIRVRASITKAESNKILASAPRESGDLEGGFAFLERYFEKVMVGWSLVDAEGNPIEPSLEAFREMDSAGANWIEQTLSKDFNLKLGKEVEQLEGESSS